MSKATDTLMFLAIHNSWRRGDETFEMQNPTDIGAAIDDAVNLLRKYDELDRQNTLLIEQNEALAKENAELKAWKESALSLNAEMDEQALAKMLGGKLGRSCRKIIAEKVPMLVEENAALREDSQMLNWLLNNCGSFVTVDHTTGEPDIYVIEASREAIRYELEKEME